MVRNGTTIGTDTQTFTGPELLAQDSGPTGVVTNYGYQSFTGPYGIPFFRLASQSNGQSSVTYNYDETTPTPTSGLPQHEPVSTSRGNLTSVHQLVSGTTTIPTQTLTYDDAGEVLTAKDGDNNVTAYGHDATDTFVATVTRPQTNGINHISSAIYDINTGLMTSSTDENSQTTSYAYDDLERPTTINYPDGGKTTYSYTPTSATQEVLESGTTTLNTTVDVGGMGRVIHVYYPNGSVVDTTHDPDGRVACVSNPHGSGSSPTDGNTCYTYDVLNRVLTVTNPDTSRKTASYNGETETLTDESGHQKQFVSDAMGRIVTALEPNSSGVLSWETDYTWNALNELQTVTQKGDGSSGTRVRTFNYDDEGRLTSQVTPEQGTTTFGYDNNSNLTSKTDARGITVTYGYDALNRMISKTASDGSMHYAYVYDVTATGYGFTSSYPVGRLVEESNQVNASSQYAYNTSQRYLKF